MPVSGIILVIGGIVAGGCGLYGAIYTRRQPNYYPVQRLLFAAVSAWGAQLAVRSVSPDLLDNDALRAIVAIFLGGVACWGAILVHRRNGAALNEEVTLSGRMRPVANSVIERQIKATAALIANGTVSAARWMRYRREAQHGGTPEGEGDKPR